MIKQPGVFSKRYLMRRGKENVNQSNVQHHHSEHDFPLAYTSAKTISKERNSISVKRKEQKRNDNKELEEKNETIAKLQRDLRESKEQLRKLAKEAQTKCSQYDDHIKELHEQLREKENLLSKVSSSLKEEMKIIKEERVTADKYKETIKKQIYWLLYLFKAMNEDTKIDFIKNEITSAFMSFKEYITEFNIEKELQALISVSISHRPSETSTYRQQPSKKNMDSIFTEDLEDLNMIKIMELQPLIETFNNQQQYCAAPEEQNHKMQRITKRLFDDSEVFRESHQNSVSIDESKMNHANDQSENEFLPKEDLPKEVRVTKEFNPDSRHENYIVLKQGDTLKLLRKIRDKLWIGEVGQKIGLVSQEYFALF